MLEAQTFFKNRLPNQFISNQKTNYRTYSKLNWRLVNPFESTHRLMQIDGLETKSHFLTENSNKPHRSIVRSSTILGRKFFPPKSLKNSGELEECFLKTNHFPKRSIEAKERLLKFELRKETSPEKEKMNACKRLTKESFEVRPQANRNPFGNKEAEFLTVLPEKIYRIRTRTMKK